MAARHKLTPEKRNIISSLIEIYDIKTMSDIQDALKNLLGGTIQGMLAAELDEKLGYKRCKKTEETKANFNKKITPGTTLLKYYAYLHSEQKP